MQLRMKLLQFSEGLEKHFAGNFSWPYYTLDSFSINIIVSMEPPALAKKNAFQNPLVEKACCWDRDYVKHSIV